MQVQEQASKAATFAQEVVERWPYAAPAAAAIVAALIAQYLLIPDPLAGIPIVGKGGVHTRRKTFVSGRAREMYLEGYKKVYSATNAMFRITTSRESETIVIDPKYAKELSKLPDDVLSFDAAIKESMQDKYVHLSVDDPAFLPHMIKTNLTPALGRLNPVLAQEVRESMKLELPQSSEWTTFALNPKLMRIVAIASGRIFIGPELCLNEAYLDAAINYTVDLMIAVHIVQFMPTWLRPILAPWMPHVRKIDQHRQKAKNFLVPVVTARRKAAAEGGQHYVKPDDLLQWMDDELVAKGHESEEELARHQLGTSFAAIHTTTMAVTNSLYTLASMPEIIPMLREDVQQALASANGEYTSLALQNMKKLDSFIKENLRFYPLGAGSFQRKVLKPFQLSNGQVVPAGVVIELPQSPVAADAAYHGNPETFDPLRFYKLRLSKDGVEDGSGTGTPSKMTGSKAAEITAASQFISVSPSSLTFGLGRHACPGRFFAANEVKMIMANVLLDYDISLPEGVTERPANLTFGASLVPDPKQLMRMRRVTA